MFHFETILPLHQNWYQSKDFYVDLMAEDDSSVKRTIDDKRWFKKIEQRRDSSQPHVDGGWIDYRKET